MRAVAAWAAAPRASGAAALLAGGRLALHVWKGDWRENPVLLHTLPRACHASLPHGPRPCIPVAGMAPLVPHHPSNSSAPVPALT